MHLCSYYRIIKILSLLSVALSLVVLLTAGYSIVVSLEAALIVAAVILLLLPLKVEDIKSSFIFALCYLILAIICEYYFWELQNIVAISISFLTIYAAYQNLLRYKQLRPLFSQKAIWNSALELSFMMRAMSLSSLSVLGLICGYSRKIASLVVVALLLAYYIVLLLRTQKGYYLPLKHEKEQELRHLVSGKLSDGPSVREQEVSAKMRELINKIYHYMESSKAYLNADFSLDVLALNVYTNKSYLSKTINMLTGGNFRQMVNRYRVEYAVSLIRDNPHLRMEEVSTRSGFHTTVTFNMAFKLYMDDTPGEYAIKVRSHLV